MSLSGTQLEPQDGIGVCKHPSVRLVNEEQATVVRRIFQMTADGMGLQKIRTKLNSEGIPGPRSTWAITGVREVLHRRDYIGEITTNRIQRARDNDGNPIRVEQPESAWKKRRDESLRIVTDQLWEAAHARVAQTKKAYLTRGRQLVGKIESTKGSYLLSGFLTCYVCRKPLIATRRGRNATMIYLCREHRERGNAGCTNTTGVPGFALHRAVVAAMRATFTPESFREHLEKQAANVEAREQRAAERARLLAELPKMAAVEQRLVKRIALIEDDALVGALKDEWSAAKAGRELAERRVAEIEGIERDLAANTAEIEQLATTWGSWSQVLAQTQAAPDTIPAGLQDQARQILKKLLASTILVKPNERGDWSFACYTKLEGLALGGLNHSEIRTYTWPTEDGFLHAERDLLSAGDSDARDSVEAPM